MQLELPILDHCAETFKPSEANRFGVRSNLVCNFVDVCCGRMPKWAATLQRVGGYELPHIAPEAIRPIPDLPFLVHSVKGDLSHIGYLPDLRGDAWAVPYLRALGDDLDNPFRLTDWLERQQLSAAPLILLHQEAKDSVLERVFERTYHESFFPLLASAPNCVSIAPGYSIYDDGSMCRHHQLYNLKRSVDFFARASRQGIPCIPSIGWDMDEDLDRVADWVKAHPTLCYLAINCQTIREKRFVEVSAALRRIETRARELRWVVFGGPGISTHLNAEGFTGRVHLVTTSHFHAARVGRSLDPAAQPQGQRELFLHNLYAIQSTFAVALSSQHA